MRSDRRQFLRSVGGIGEWAESVDKIVWQVQIGKQLPARNSGGFVDDGKPATWVGTAADQIDSVEVFELVAWSQVEHLSKVMGQVERGTSVDAEIISPGARGDDLFVLDVSFEVLEPDLA